MAFDCHSTYPNEDCKDNINFYRHIRNAISHSKCDYVKKEECNCVIFKDDDPRNSSHHCEVTIKTESVDHLVKFLMDVIMDKLKNSIGSNQ